MRAAPTRVSKRNGRDEAFDALRLADSLRAALRGAGNSEDHAPALTDAICRVLAARESHPSTAEIGAAVESVLERAGFVQAGRLYRAYRRGRHRRRARIRVHTESGGRRSARPWDRDRLAQGLVRDRYIDSTIARQIARAVEGRLVACGYGHVSARLVAAMADNECRARGLRGDAVLGDRIGVDRRSLRAWIGGECLPSALGGSPVLLPDGADSRPYLGGDLLARFALEEILSRPQATALETGSFDLPALGDWLRPACLRMSPKDDEEEEAFWDRVARSREQAREIQAVWPARREPGAPSRLAPRWMEGGATRLRVETGHPGLAVSWADEGRWVRMPLEDWLRCGAEDRRALHRSGRVRLGWTPERHRPRPSSVLDGQAVLNLAAAARRSGTVRAFLADVGETVDLACAALRTLARRGRGQQHPLVSLVPAGLPDAIAILVDEDAGTDPVRRLLLGLRERVERQARTAGVRLLAAVPPHPEGAGARLAALDRIPGLSSYSVGWHLQPLACPPASVALDTAPWLEFPAAENLEPAANRLRAYTTTSDARREREDD